MAASKYLGRVQRVGKVLDQSISALAPSWASKRAINRATAQQATYLAAAYELASRSTSGRVATTLRRSQDGYYTEADLISIRDNSEELYRKYPIYSGLLRRAADNIIGTGLEVNPRTDDAALNTDIKAGFAEHTKAGGPWEVTRTVSLMQQQRLTFFSLAREGDMLAYRADEGWQFFQANQIGTPLGFQNKLDLEGGSMVMGVQKNSLGQHARYWVADQSRLGYIEAANARGIRADKCKHIALREWVNQTRGMPVYHNALASIEDFGHFLDTTLLDAITSSMSIVEVNSPHANALKALGVLKTEQADVDRLKRIEIQPTQVVHTFTGEKIAQHGTNRPGPQFDPYTRMNIRMLGIPVGLPLEIGLMDFSQTNFAAAKMAVSQAMLTFLWWTSLIDDGLNQPVYLDYLQNEKTFRRWMQKKEIKPFRYEIIPPKSAWLEPYKETMAINLAIEEGWESRIHAVKENMNRELIDVVRENAEEILILQQVSKEKGITVEELEKHRSSLSAGSDQPALDNNMKAIAATIAEEVVSRL